MKKIYKYLVSIAGVGLLMGCSAHYGNTANNTKSTYKLSIAHVDDVHSHLDSDKHSFHFNLDGNPSNGNETKVKIPLGGMAKVKTKIDELRKTKKNLLVVNAGDLIQGTLYFTSYEGKATFDMYNLINWDVFVLGNHEFDLGDGFLKGMIEQIRGKTGAILSANIKSDGTIIPSDYWKAYTIKEIGGQKIGIVGITVSQKTKVSSRPSKHIMFKDEFQSAQKAINKLTKMGINKIVLVSHIGLKNDIKIAQKLKGVDVIIGGDSHSLMGDYSAVGLKSASKMYPEIVKNADGKSVCIAHAWEYAYGVGDLDVSFDKNGDVTACMGQNTLLLGNTFLIKKEGKYKAVEGTTRKKILNVINTHANLEIVPDDKEALRVFKPYKDQIKEKMKVVIGKSTEFLGHNRIPYDKKDGVSILPQGSDIAPIVCKSFVEADPNADVCIQNAGGIRTPIDDGDITIGEAYTMLPFKNTLFEIKMKGSEIKQVLNDALNNYLDNGGSTGSFPYAYALRYNVDVTKPANQRISALEVMNKKTKKWSAIDKDKMYVVITNSYTAEGHDGYVTFKRVQDKRGKGVDTYLDYAMSFVDYVKNNTPISKLPKDQRPIKCFIDKKHNSECSN